MQNIPTQKLNNFRDLGGLKTQDGRTIRENCFLRTGTLHNLPEVDSALLQKHGLSHIIDLRIADELRRQPDTVPAGVQYSNIPLREDVMDMVTRRRGMSYKEYLNAIPSMPELYVRMVSSDFSLDAQRKIFDIVVHEAAPGNAVLFHCSEGKDRTGIVAALILKYLGVPDDVIYEDYMLSNEPFVKRNERYYKATRLFFRDKEQADRFRYMYEANENMLRGMFDVVDSLYGGVGPFLTDALGIPATDLEAFRARVLA